MAFKRPGVRAPSAPPRKQVLRKQTSGGPVLLLIKGQSGTLMRTARREHRRLGLPIEPRRFRPQPLQIVVVSLHVVKDVHNDAAVVHQRPAGSVIALPPPRMPAYFREAFVDGLDNGPHLR